MGDRLPTGESAVELDEIKGYIKIQRQSHI